MTVQRLALLAATLAGAGCASPTADCGPSDSAAALSVVDPNWRAAVDSLIATLPGDEIRGGVAYGPSESLAAQISDIGFHIRRVFVGMEAVSFEGEVHRFGELKDIQEITALYIANPENEIERAVCE